MIKYLFIIILLSILLGGCTLLSSNNNVFQILYPSKESISIQNKYNEDKIIKAIFPDAEIKHLSGEKGAGYLVIGKKWAVSFVLPEDEGDNLGKYITINNILNGHIFADRSNQIIVTLHIYVPHTSDGDRYSVALAVLEQNGNDYKILSEYYDCGRRVSAPTTMIDINNDGMKEILLLSDDGWTHPWGSKYLAILQSKNNTLVNIFETDVQNWSYQGIDDTFKSDSIVELIKNNTGYPQISKTTIKLWYAPSGVEDPPEPCNEIIMEYFLWNGEKYISSATQVIFERTVTQESSQPADESQSSSSK